MPVTALFDGSAEVLGTRSVSAAPQLKCRARNIAEPPGASERQGYRARPLLPDGGFRFSSVVHPVQAKVVAMGVSRP